MVAGGGLVEVAALLGRGKVGKKDEVREKLNCNWTPKRKQVGRASKQEEDLYKKEDDWSR